MDPKDEIKEKLDVVEVIREYIPLKPAGSNWKGLCPFHQEKTPSFMVSQERQSWYCFGCNVGGDVFSFVMKHENMDFGEVLRMFAERTGVQLRHDDAKLRTQKTTTLDIMEAAVKWWQMQLFDKSGEPAREYMKKRGLNREIADEWKLGFAPDSWEGLSDYLVGHGFKLADIIASGLVIEQERKQGDKRLPFYDRFRNRIMFPIRDVRGRFVGATGRVMSHRADNAERADHAEKKEEAKYINTPETAVYHKSGVLYGLDRAKDVLKETKCAVLVEGNMDVIASHRAGVTQAVATSGTALTPDHAKLVKRFADTVALSFDADEAGLRAAKRSIALLLRAGLQVSRIVLPEGVKDPDECVQRDPKEWQTAVLGATPIFQFLFTEARAKDIRNVLVKKEVAKELLALIAVLPDPVEKGHYMKELSALLEVPENLLYEALPREKKGVLPVASGETGSGSAGDNAAKRNRSSQEVLSEKLLSLLVKTPNSIAETVAIVPPEALSAGPLRDLYTDLQSLYSKNSVSEHEVQDFFTQRAEVRDRLALAAEHYFHELDSRAIDHERSQIINALMRASIKTELTRLEQRLAATTDSAAQQELLQRVGELSRRISDFS